MHGQKHLFALYLPTLSSTLNQQQDDVLVLRDRDLWQRLTRVLRVSVGEHITFFDNKCHVTVRLDEQALSTKNTVSGSIVTKTENSPLAPTLTLYAPLTKKDAFESMLYNAAQLGVSDIQPFLSEKIHRMWWGPKDKARCEKIMIAGCEQAKQFIVPTLHEPVNLTAITAQATCNIYFEAGAQPLAILLSNAKQKKYGSFSLLIGPEGGLTNGEMSTLNSKSFCAYSLTPTILRSQDAALVALGLIRSLC
ncbi:MAG: 16S rRNA (uracil(1498)-N(3))-methyltransferase [Epsilonproteobacteria bacterium]|nr:16S rRNA (uracil(1498)-N(3))-methyltransferase [Campylobacterota bacterium]